MSERADKIATKSGAEADVLYGRRWYCYLSRAGVVASIKRQMRRRLRRRRRAEIRTEMEPS